MMKRFLASLLLLLTLLTTINLADAGFFRPGSFGDFMVANGGPGGVDSPTVHWMYENGSGTTVTDEKGVADITLSATCDSWANGGCDYDWDTASSEQTTANGTLNTITSGSFSGWEVVSWDSYVNGKYVMMPHASGIAGAANYSIILYQSIHNTFNKVRLISSNGVGITSIYWPDALGSVSLGTKYFIAYAYTRAGGGTNNTLTIWAGTDCSSLQTASDSASVLAKNDANYEVHNAVAGEGINGVYYDAGIHVGTVYTNTQAQNLCNWVMNESNGDW